MNKNNNEFSYLSDQNSTEDEQITDYTPEFYKPSCYQEEYIDMRKVIDPQDKRPRYDDEIEIEEFIKAGFMPIYASSTGDIAASSGMGAELTYGMLQIDEEPCYFVVVDDPGASGYDCCGLYRVYYSFNLEKFLEEQAYTQKERELLNKLYTH